MIRRDAMYLHPFHQARPPGQEYESVFMIVQNLDAD